MVLLVSPPNPRPGRIRSSVIRLLCAVICLASPTWAQEPEGTAEQTGALAWVGSIAVTATDVDALLRTRRRDFPEDTEAVRQRALEQLVAEIALEAQLEAREEFLSAEVGEALADARRQVLFKSYAQSQFRAEPPTDEEVRAYVAAHPESFSQRKEYRVLRLFVQIDSADERRLARAAIARLQNGETITSERLDGLAGDLQGLGIAVARQPFWGGGDTLPASERARLDAMQAEGISLEISERPRGIELVHLAAIRAAPLPPAIVKQQVVARIQLEKLQAHQAALARELSTPHIGRPAAMPEEEEAAEDEREDEAQDRVTLVASGLFGFGAALSLLSAIRWVGTAGAYRRQMLEQGRDLSETRFLNRRAAAMAGAGICAVIVVTAAGAWTLSRPLPQGTPVLKMAALVVGGAGLGIGTALLHAVAMTSADIKPIAFARPALLGAMACMALSAGIIGAI